MSGKGWDRAHMERKSRDTSSPVTRWKVRVVQMKSVFDLAEERCEVVRVPNCFCFLNDEGGKIIS